MAAAAEEAIASAAAAYPAATKQSAGVVGDVFTQVTCTSLSDKIMITIVQEGRLAQWIRVSLENADPNSVELQLPSASNEDSLLPMAHLTPVTLLGETNTERETLGHLYAAQIASAILSRRPDEDRVLLLGLGLKDPGAEREIFYDLIELALKAL